MTRDEVISDLSHMPYEYLAIELQWVGGRSKELRWWYERTICTDDYFIDWGRFHSYMHPIRKPKYDRDEVMSIIEEAMRIKEL